MTKPNGFHLAVGLTVTIVGAALFGLATPSTAQTANNVVCIGCVGASDLADGAATRSKVRNFAIDTSKLAGSAVSSAKIATGAVTRSRIRDFAVNGSKLAGSAVTTAKIANSAVTAGKIANNAVTGAKIANNAVTGAKIADNAVTGAKIADNAVTDAKIADNAVTGAKIANNAVTGAKIANATITGADIADGAVAAANLGLARTTFLEDSGSDTDNCANLRDALNGLVGPGGSGARPRDVCMRVGLCRPAGRCQPDRGRSESDNDYRQYQRRGWAGAAYWGRHHAARPRGP